MFLLLCDNIYPTYKDFFGRFYNAIMMRVSTAAMTMVTQVEDPAIEQLQTVMNVEVRVTGYKEILSAND